MLEYIFFHTAPMQRFVQALQARGVPCQSKDDDMGLVVAVPEDLDDALDEEIDALYETLLAESESLLDEDEAAEQHIAALSISLSNGQNVQAAVDPGVLDRILTVITPQELNDLVDAIVSSVEQPDFRPVCQRETGGKGQGTGRDPK